MITSRRAILAAVGGAAVAGIRAQETEPPKLLDQGLVHEFVAKSHADFNKVRELVTSEPMLANASRDWGSGDWETGLGAAAHMGRRDIAQFLIEKGARLNVFALVMLGETRVAKALLSAFPEMHKTPGPHGIPLLSHAIAGGDQAKDVFELLIEAGADVNQAANRGTTPLMQAAQRGHADQVQRLLEEGADRLAKDHRGMTALDVARRKDLAKIVAILQEG